MLDPCRGSSHEAGSSTSRSGAEQAIVQLQEPMNLSSASDLGAAFMFSACAVPQYQQHPHSHQQRDKSTTRHTLERTGSSYTDELDTGGMGTHLAALHSAAAWTAADECFRLEAARQLASLHSAVAGALQAQGGGGCRPLAQVGAHHQHPTPMAGLDPAESPLNLGGGQIMKDSRQAPNNNTNTRTSNHMGGQSSITHKPPTSGGPPAGQRGACRPAEPASRRHGQESRKCRKFYGVARRSLWCTQCRWKKACTRFWDPKSGTPPRAKSLRGPPSITCASSEIASPLSGKANGQQQQQQLYWIHQHQPLVHRQPATQLGQEQHHHQQQPQLRKCHRPHGSLGPELSLHLRQSS